VVEYVWKRWNAEHAQKYAIPVAAGFIAGDALVAVILPILYVLKVMSPP
jgi:hypothetical protein